MALVITVGGVDITDYVRVESISVEQSMDLTAVCRFVARDHSGTIAIDPEDAVTITDGGSTTFFSGKVKDPDDAIEGLGKVWNVMCVDHNGLLDETVVTNYTIDAGDADDTEIDTIFSTYRSDIDSTTYVSQLEASMPQDLDLGGMTLRDALNEICRQTGGQYYVDFDKNLHYFDAVSNAAAWDLSDAPNGSTLFGYSGFKRRRSSAQKATRFWIQGNGITGWVTGVSYSSGDPEGVIRDNRITSTAARDAAGASALAKYEDDRHTYELDVREDGLQAGMSIDVTNTIWGLSSETLTIRTIRMRVEDKTGDARVYHLTLGDGKATNACRANTTARQVATLAQEAAELDDTVFDDNAPGAPTFVAGNLTTGVELDADGHQIVYIRATWGSVSDDDLDHYEVQLADNSSFNWPMVGLIQAGDTREYQWNGLQGNISYYARVRAVDWVGNYSAWSPQPTGYLTVTSAADSTPPAQVTGEAAAGARTLIGVTWNDNTEADLSHYEVQSSPNGSSSWTSRDYPRRTMFLDEDFTEAQIAAGTARYYRIRAIDTSGNAGDWSTTVNASTNPIGSDTIAAGAIITDKLAANCVTAAKIAANTITASEIATGTITATQITGSTLSAIYANMGLLTAGEIRIGSGTVGSNYTGFRIMSSYLAGYNNNTLQAGIRVSDGKFIAAGGKIIADEDGLRAEDTSDLASNIIEARRIISTSPSEYMGVALSATSSYGIIEGGEGGATPATSQILFDDGNVITFKNASTTAAVTMDFSSGATVTIDQQALDNKILIFKSSDVAHGATTIAETDTYGFIQKSQDTSGGLSISGLKDADGIGGIALQMEGYLAENANTAKTTAARAIVEVRGWQTSGTVKANTVANGNVFCVRTQRGGAATTVAIIDEDGDIHYDGSTSSYDDYDDALMAMDLAHLMSGEYEKLIAHGRCELETARIIGAADEHGRFMVSTKRLNALLLGAVGQLWQRCQRYELAMANAGLLEG